LSWRRINERIRGVAPRLRPRALAAALSLTLLAAALGASSADARGLRTGFTDNNIFDPSAPPTANRDMWLDRAVSARAGIIRITVDWRNAVRRKPANPINPADPAYGFARLDTAIRSATMRGLDVMLTVYRAPDWAEGAHPPRGIQPGAWKPDATAYGKFAQALARRYSGHFHGLPRVRYFEAWTEPNLTQFLAPQWEGKALFAPRRYRQLLNSFYAGVHAAQPGATVIAGATSSFGDSRTHQLYPAHPRMHPMVFLRTVLCLNAKLKRTKGCTEKTHLDALSAHPLNITKGPNYKPRSKDDLQVATFGRLGRLLNAAKRANTVLPEGPHPLWATEEGMLSDPPNPQGVAPQVQARWIEEVLYLLWKQGASTVVNLNLRDPTYDPSRSPGGQWTTGLFFRGGKAKPAFKSWRFPFVTHRKSKRQVSAWGKAPGSGTLRIEQLVHGHWRPRKAVTVRAGQVFTPTFRLKGTATLRARVGSTTSLSWHQSG